jgi:hypothetical protein
LSRRRAARHARLLAASVDIYVMILPRQRKGLARRLEDRLKCGSPCSVFDAARTAEKNLPEELFREASPLCRTCQREEERRNPVVRIAAGIIATPREQWAKDFISRLQQRGERA